MDGDISEAICKIEDLVSGRIAAENHVVSDISVNRIRTFCAKTGEFKWHDVPSLPLIATVNSVADLVEAESLYVNYELSQATVWVETNQAVLFVDSERKGKVTLPLRVNPAIALIGTLKNLQPKVLHRRLKVDLFATEISPFDFAETIGSLKFETTDTTESKLRKGDESIAKSVRSKVTGEIDLPDEASFQFEFYPDLSSVNSNVEIRCAVIAEPAEGTISVIPYPGEIERASIRSIEYVARAIAESLHEGSDTKVFCGKCC
jgi:hypothetical protein